MVAAVASYGSLSLTQAAMTYAVTPSAETPSADDQPEASQTASDASEAQQLAASNINLTPASMAALIQAQASITQGAPAMIRQHTAERIGEMIWRLDDAPALSPAPFAVRQLQAARKALSDSLIDLRA
ncbi:hypothetical protein [Phenylobacterium sp.]|uniref:hypothetical protein n=1 Tax=Phenylobacterium sp. TaxID=1871053 RepID=UPI002D02223D|nr:hypothetical protein [Phenylobacterium sp.]HLZ77566.1 hypothetical protein [Phenylobacterium sp.]